MKPVTGENVESVLREDVDTTAKLFMGELSVYATPGNDFAPYETVAPGKGENCRGEVHSN